MELTDTVVKGVLDSVYEYSRTQDYKGYNKHDGLNSPLLKDLLGWSKWTRIIAIQTVMRVPINLRPFLGMPKTYNPKGLALFARGLLEIYQKTNDLNSLQEAKELLALLKSQRSPGNWAGICWGYHYPWQDLGFYSGTNTPNAVVSSFVCEVFLNAFRVTGKSEYLEIVHDCLQFFTRDLTVLKDTQDQLCFAYMPLPMEMRVLDVSALIAAVMAQYGQLSGDRSYTDTAYRLANYVVQQQTEYAAWFYTDPPGDSLIRHDNYHTGFILDAIWRYMQATGDTQWQSVYDKGLAYYAEHLFNPDGSPRWMNDKDYPHDIHGAAQGIITFSRHPQEYPGLAEKIARWAITAMYDKEGRFYYQQTPYFIKRFTLLRWCNAWMAYALAVFYRKV